MFKLALKSLFARKLRLILTSLAIVLGVSFVVSSFVIADSLRSTFDDLVEDVQGETDLTVRTFQEFGEEYNRPPIDASILDDVRSVEGVKAADGSLNIVGITPIDDDGDPVKVQGPPLLGVNYGTEEELSQLIQIEGRRPEGPNEFNLDIDTAEDHDFVVGRTYTVTSPATGNRQFELVGLVAFNSEDNDTVGAVLSVFDDETLQEFGGRVGQYNGIVVAVEDGADVATVQQRITDVIPAGTEVVDRTVTIEEQKDDFDEISTILGNVLLAFALITVVVSAFIINNTFQIVIGQRVRELALLRALGATGRQVSRSVLLESFVIGVIATVLGIGVGLVLSLGLRQMFKAFGFALPDGPLLLEPRTIIAAAIVGIGVTVLASLAPARKARRVPPIAALRDDFQLVGTSLTRRLVLGGVVTAVGALLIAYGLLSDLETAPLLTSLSIGALMVFVGVNLLSPLAAKPVARTLGAPVQRAYGTTGRLSRENSARNPRRTSSTAAALMIGLALVSMAAVVGDSLKATFVDILDSAVTADYFVSNEQQNDPTAGMPPSYTQELAQQPEFESVIPYRFSFNGIKIAGDTKDLNSTELGRFAQHLDIDVVDGTTDGADDTNILLHEDSAEDLGLQVGDTVDVTFVDQQVETLEVAAIYEDSSILGNYVIDLETWKRHFANDVDQFVTVKLAEGVDPDQAASTIERITAPYPQIQAETREEFKDSLQSQLDSFLAVITGFLGFALLIALMGIANTLALSVFERTRELGLLRAVGMSRRQLRRMVRWEAAIVAVFGALLGVVLGIIFGVAAASALPSSFIKTISIPYGTIVIYVIIAGFAGLLAAWGPARRAGKLNVLDAISYA